MTQAQQPEALRLAHALGGGKLIDDSTEWADTLHARIAELEAQLSAIGAGGVEPLRKQAVRRAPAEPVISETQVLAITTAYEQGVGKGHQSHAHKETITNPYDKEWGCDSAWQMGYAEGREQAERTNLATTPQPPAAAPAQPGWCDGCSPDNCVGCGPAAPAQVQPEPNREQS